MRVLLLCAKHLFIAAMPFSPRRCSATAECACGDSQRLGGAARSQTLWRQRTNLWRKITRPARGPDATSRQQCGIGNNLRGVGIQGEEMSAFVVPPKPESAKI